MLKPYRVIVGSFQQVDPEGQKNEFSRGDLVLLTDEEAAANDGAVEPWADPNQLAPVPTPAETDDELAKQLEAVTAERDALRAQLEAATSAAAVLTAERDELAKQLEAATAPPAETSKKK